ncbi:beta/gamma crystallin family protein [Duganella sp. sic0402]|uniref:beta/gamma crystallin-related protein n=1 Tax=Duganella sp. sic0402 TaxID=2854786 RepID=UPI001C44CD85|nr:beta/gamma crystallin-related protein [Duganella sp. sic0402]MBV7536096.1 beta/gamma crystallin family protein [Duganella sp. sic0402]
MHKILAAAAFSASALCSAGDITLYSHERLGGPAITLHEATPDLDPLGFNDKTSSVVVHKGSWQVCAEKHYKGKCLVLAEGEYAELKGFNNMISSAREVDAPRRERQ